MRRGGWMMVSVLGLSLSPARAWPQETPATTLKEGGGRELLSSERIAVLSGAERVAWTVYVQRSQRLHAADTASMNAELRATGRTVMIKAAYSASDFDLYRRDDDWFRSDSARLVADAILTFQTPSGGWSARSDMTRPRSPGMSYSAESESWLHAPTFDNGATTGQMRFLARRLAIEDDPRYGTAYHRGIGYLLAAQQPNGCWPQSYPLEGGPRDAITFSDDVTVLVLTTLTDVAAGSVPGMSASERGRSTASVRRGIACLVATQVVVDGRRTIWGLQHDPITLEVIPERRNEPEGLAGRESASILTYLMTLPHPESSVMDAVHAAAAWFKSPAVRGRPGFAAQAAGALTIYDEWASAH